MPVATDEADLDLLDACEDAADVAEDALYARAAGDFPTYCRVVAKDEKGRPLVWGAIHERIWRHICDCERGGNWWIVECPWGTGKTGTFVVALRTWKIGQDTDRRHKVVSSSDDPARARVATVKHIIEEDPDYARAFPHVVPDRAKDWSDHKITVERSAPSPDATLESWGVDSKALGGSADDLIFDDVVAEAERYSRAARDGTAKRVKGAWLSRVRKGGIVGVVATPWHEEDAVAQLAENPKFSRLRIRVKEDFSAYAVEVDGKPDGELPFDEHLTADDRREQARGLGATYAALGLQLDVSAGASKRFDPDTFAYFDPSSVDPATLKLRMFMDPGGGESPGQEKQGQANYCAIVVGGRNAAAKSDENPKGTIDIVDVWLDNKATPHPQARQFCSMADKWGVGTAGVEDNTGKNWWVPQIRREQKRRFTVRPMTTSVGTGNKIQRIERLDGALARGELRFCRALLSRCPEYFRQWASFPGDNDDGPDATEGLVRMIESGTVDMVVV